MAWSTPRDWSNGEIVTQTMLNTDVRDNMRELWHEVAYTEFTANVVSSAANTEGSPLDVVSSGAVTYAAIPAIIEFYCPGYSQTGQGALSLWDASTDLGRLTTATPSNYITPGLHVVRRLTPTAASHTYKVRGWGNGTGTCYAGAGGTATHMPGFIRVLVKGGT